MTDLNFNLFKLEQVLSIESPGLITSCHFTSCGKLGVATLTGGPTPLIAISLQEDFKIHWISWFQDSHMAPVTFCFSSKDDLLLIGTSSGTLCVVPSKSLFLEHGGANKKVRIVRGGHDQAVCSRRVDPTAICWWATNEAKVLAVLGTRHGFLIIIDLVDGKEIGHVKISEKPIVTLEQIVDDTNDSTYLFITDDHGKQWRQLLEQKSTGFTWCGANEIARTPKTPTLEKASVSCQRSLVDHPVGMESSQLENQMSSTASSSQIDEDFTTRSRLAGLKQMSVASLASLKQRLNASRKLFDRRLSGPNEHSADFLSVPHSGNEISCTPEPTAAKVGDTKIFVLTDSKGCKMISGLFRDTAILTSHNTDLEVLPQVAFKLPKQTYSVLLLDKLILVKVGQNILRIVSAHFSEINLEKTKEDPVLQSFVMPQDEKILSFHKIIKANNDNTDATTSNSKKDSAASNNDSNSNTSPTSSSSASSSKEDSNIDSSRTANPCDQLTKEVQSKVESAKTKGQTMIQPCLIVTNKAIYIMEIDEDPVSAFLDLVTQGQSKEAERLASTFALENSEKFTRSLYELAADIKLTRMDFAGAINLYMHSGCKHLKAVLKFAASGHVEELLSYLTNIFKTVNLELTNSDRIHLSNLTLMAYFQQALASEVSVADELRSKVVAFLDSNQWFDECLAVRLATETREWKLLGHLALSRGLFGDMLVAIATAFGQLLALDTDNVKHLQDGMTKVLQDMPSNERKGLLKCLVYQSDNLVTCLAFPVLGEQIIRILIGLLPLMDDKDFLAVIEQCRPDRIDFWPILWPLLTTSFNGSSKEQHQGSSGSGGGGDNNSDFGLLLINFYVTVQLMALKKSSNCDVTLVNKVLMQDQLRSSLISSTIKLPPIVKIRCKSNLMAAGSSHVLLIRPKSGQLMSWGAFASGVLGHSTTLSRFSSPKPVDFFAGMNKGGHVRLTVISVSCGKAHSMALTDCGLYTWGSSKHGQLGHGPKVIMAKHPTLVSQLANFTIVGIACGQYHSVAWNDKGLAWTWGWGVHGQLGHDSIEDEFWPCRLILKDRVIMLDCGYAHTVALTMRGQVWTFGCGIFGQLGIGEYRKMAVPIHVVGLTDIARVVCGFFHNMAFDKEGQRLYIWGCNPQVLRMEAQQKRKDRLQNKIVEEAQAHEDELTSDELKAVKKTTEKQVTEIPDVAHLTPSMIDTSLFTVESAASGNQHSLILTSTGGVLSFGRNLDGQLGIGSRKESKMPTLVSGLQDDVIIEVACGADYSLALSEAGSVFAWGNNTNGQLGKPPLDESTSDGTNSKIFVMKSTKRIIRLQHSLQNSRDIPLPVVGITSGVYSMEGMDRNKIQERALEAVKLHKEHLSLFSIFDNLDQNHAKRLHVTYEAFYHLLEPKKLIKKCLISDNPQAASKLSLLNGNILQAFDFMLQCYIKSGIVGGQDIFEAFNYYLHSEDVEDQPMIKRQLLERLIACWQDQKFSFIQLEQMFIQNFDALLLQILVLTLFCPNDERPTSIDNFPLLNSEETGPKLVDLFTPEFCLKVGDTFVKTLKTEDPKSPAVNQWLEQQKKGSVSGDERAGSGDPLTHLVTDLIHDQK